MKTKSFVIKAIAFAVGAALAAPKAVGIALISYVDAMPVARLNDGGPADLKALEKALDSARTIMEDGIKKMQDKVDKALDEVKENGTLHGKTNEAITALSTESKALADNYKVLADRTRDLEQKLATGGVPSGSGSEEKSIEQVIIESEQFKDAVKRGASAKSMDAVVVKSFHHKTQIVNASGQNQPLVPSQRVNGIIVPPEQRLHMRDIVPSTTTDSNLIEYALEASFTSAAAPQGGGSPGNAEGELKAEAAMTFSQENRPVITLAHWIPASRQVLADAKLLAGHINVRLIYGLKLKEDQDILTGTGAAGTLNGICNQAAAFSYGVTNQTPLDTLLKALLQVSLSNFDASAFVLHPINWTDIQLLKDTTGRYLFTNPQDATTPRLWAKPVVPTASMTLNKFLAGAFSLGAQIWDREDATVRVSENVNDHFIRNLVAVLAEERLALTVYRPSAFVYGNISHAG